MGKNKKNNTDEYLSMLDYLMNQQSKYEKSWVKLDIKLDMIFCLNNFPQN